MMIHTSVRIDCCYTKGPVRDPREDPVTESVFGINTNSMDRLNKSIAMVTTMLVIWG